MQRRDSLDSLHRRDSTYRIMRKRLEYAFSHPLSRLRKVTHSITFYLWTYLSRDECCCYLQISQGPATLTAPTLSTAETHRNPTTRALLSWEDSAQVGYWYKRRNNKFVNGKGARTQCQRGTEWKPKCFLLAKWQRGFRIGIFLYNGFCWSWYLSQLLLEL